MLSEKNKHPAVVLLLSIFLLELIRTAWIGDDAAITLRTVLNFVNGYGPTFNIDERVQAYTHPLWFFLISAISLIVGNVFAATFLLSICVSLFALWVLLTKVATNTGGAIVAGIALVLSKAYLDYATSGLENPLSHVLILTAVLMAVRALDGGRLRDLTLFFLSCSLIYLNRPDLLALVFPLAVLVAVRAAQRNVKQLIRAAMIGALPVVGWTVFSTYYYGFPFPNTAYAKLGTGIALDERLLQGGRYILHGVNRDPITACFIAAGVAVGLFGSGVSISLAIGTVLYLAYVMSIGGDFMEGRFFTAPLLVAAVIVSRSRLDRAAVQALGLGVLIVGLMNIHATLFSDATFTNTVINPNGIADERGYFYQRYGLLAAPKGAFTAPNWVLGERRAEVICGGLGYAGIYNGPGVHYIDDCALADPLLARLPAKYDPNWRIGHFTRQLPGGYRKSIALNKNLIADPVTRAYYDAIRVITRAPLSDRQRLRQIVNFNLGKVTRPDWDMYRNPPVPGPNSVIEVDEVELSRPGEGGIWNAPGNVVFKGSVDVVLNQPTSFSSIDLSVDNNDVYRVMALTDAGWSEVASVNPGKGVGMARHIIPLAKELAAAHRIRITAVSGDGQYSLGHLVLK
jgi:arabinofuranosyltransferase